ncbi:hypothetical protein P280DRAFT_101290 [Massarina eburnea CBS 473.64]|uniref:Uncharacterized protein n=1 Tax=Massarina eburnea CBS 473.64 TaxID=1395130 RepID=A0A6A6RQ97_9PLEO|nr:hypothetical protein P280DRAFT_101290 [Massarina eburnea CBS 473.64]
MYHNITVEQTHSLLNSRPLTTLQAQNMAVHSIRNMAPLTPMARLVDTADWVRNQSFPHGLDSSSSQSDTSLPELTTGSSEVSSESLKALESQIYQLQHDTEREQRRMEKEHLEGLMAYEMVEMKKSLPNEEREDWTTARVAVYKTTPAPSLAPNSGEQAPVRYSAASLSSVSEEQALVWYPTATQSADGKERTLVWYQAPSLALDSEEKVLLWYPVHSRAPDGEEQDPVWYAATSLSPDGEELQWRITTLWVQVPTWYRDCCYFPLCLGMQMEDGDTVFRTILEVDPSSCSRMISLRVLS